MDYWHRNDKGEAVRIKQENYNEFKTKNGRKVFDGGGVFPDKDLGVSKKSSITDAIINDYLIFDFATNYYYKNKIENIHDFKLTDADFSDFKNYLKSNDFSFETDTEKALQKAMKPPKKKGLNDNINTDYNTLISNLEKSKTKAVDENKDYLLKQLTEEIVKRYVYREGLYEYYKTYNPEIKVATGILSNLSTYSEYLR